MKFETTTATGPSSWASYLINGDCSGLDAAEKAQADAFVARIGYGPPIGCEDAGFIAYSNAWDWGIINYAADCQRYTFMRPVSR